MADTDRPRPARLDQAARRCVSGPYSGAFAVAESSNPHPRFGPRKRTWGAEPGPASAGIHAGGFDTSSWDARCRSASAHETMGCMCTKTPILCAPELFRMSLAALRLHHDRRSDDAAPELASVDGSDPPLGMPRSASGRIGMCTLMPPSPAGVAPDQGSLREGGSQPSTLARCEAVPSEPEGKASFCSQPGERASRQ